MRPVECGGMEEQQHFDCPVCSRTTVMWDPCGAFVCQHRDCASSFPPPEAEGVSAEESSRLLSDLGVTQRWLDCLVRESPATVARMVEGWISAR